MLIDQLKAYHTSTDSRPINYFEYNIEIVIIILNILSGILRISGSVIIMMFITTLKIEKKRSKFFYFFNFFLAQAEKEESFIKMNDSFKENLILNVNDNTGNTTLKIETRNENRRNSFDSDEERDIMDDNVAGMLGDSKSKERSNDLRKVSLASDSGDSYRKFETPRTITRFSQIDKN
jgi:hypothetical protein